MASKEVHGSARLSACGKYLTITVPAKRGDKFVSNAQTYRIDDVCPDPRVADPAYSLTKGELIPVPADEAEGQETHVFVPSPGGEVWHVSIRERWMECDCPAKTFGQPRCKHIAGLVAVGLLKRKEADVSIPD